MVREQRKTGGRGGATQRGRWCASARGWCVRAGGCRASGAPGVATAVRVGWVGDTAELGVGGEIGGGMGGVVGGDRRAGAVAVVDVDVGSYT